MAIGRNTIEITKSEYERVCNAFTQALEESYVEMEEEQYDRRYNRPFGRFRI